MHCPSCSITYTPTSWEELPLLGVQDTVDPIALALKNCVCGTTFALAITDADHAEAKVWGAILAGALPVVCCHRCSGEVDEVGALEGIPPMCKKCRRAVWV